MRGSGRGNRSDHRRWFARKGCARACAGTPAGLGAPPRRASEKKRPRRNRRGRRLPMGLGRVELPTSRLSGVRSNHLSYRPLQVCRERRIAARCRRRNPAPSIPQRRIRRIYDAACPAAASGPSHEPHHAQAPRIPADRVSPGSSCPSPHSVRCRMRRDGTRRSRTRTSTSRRWHSRPTPRASPRPPSSARARRMSRCPQEPFPASPRR